MSTVKETLHTEVRPVEDDTEANEKVDVNGDHANVPLPAAEWPIDPEPLKPDLVTRITTILFDTALIVIPLALLAKIGLVIAAWKQSRYFYGPGVDTYVNPMTQYLVRFNSRMVTLFTIIFITTMSTFVRRYALWKAQRGAFVTDLEQLQGSISLVSTIKLIWSLRAFTAKSLALAVIWTFYWFGSQAASEEYQMVQSAPWRFQVGAIARPGASSTFSDLAFANSSAGSSSNLRSMYTALTKVEDSFVWSNNRDDMTSYVMSHYREPRTFAGIDPDGYAAIPSLSCALGRICDTVEGAKPDKHGWMVLGGSHPTTGSNGYATMVGYPVWSNNSFTPYGDIKYLTTTPMLTSFQASTSYIDLRCGVPSNQSFSAFPNGTSFNQSITINATRTLQPAVLDASGHPLRVFDLWYRWLPNPNTEYSEDYVPTMSDKPGSMKWTCNLTQVSSDVRVGCTAAGCAVGQVRLANYTNPEQSISYSTPFDDDVFATNLINSLLLYPAPQTDLFEPSRMVSYMVTNLLKYTLETALLPGDQYGQTNLVTDVLARYINTMHVLSQRTGSVAPQVDLSWANFLQDNDTNYQLLFYRGAPYLPHYSISWPWIALDFISCAVMLVAAVLAVIFRMQTLAPDILGSVSSLTRDNPYLLLPDSGSTLTGIERARMLKKVKVKLGDISGNNYGQQVGRIGLARVGVDSSEALRVERLRKDIKYV